MACDNGFGLFHPIPHVSLGLNALVGAAPASVFLDLNTSLCRQGSVSSAASPQPCLSGNTDINVAVGVRDPSSASLTRVQEIHTSIRTSRPVPAPPGACSQPTIFLFLFSFRIFIVLSTHRQQCFGGNLPGTRIRRLSLIARQTLLRFGFSDYRTNATDVTAS